MEYTTARRKMTLRLLFGVLITLLLFLMISSYQQSTQVSHGSEVIMLDVGQGDSFLIKGKDGGTILIDGGRGSVVLSELTKVLPSTKQISVVISTHPDADHIEGLIAVLERYKVGVVILPGVYSDTETASRFYALVEEKKVPVLLGRTGLRIALSDTEHKTILFPDRDVTTWETNAASIVSRFDAEKASALFTGDAPLSVEKYLINNYRKYLDVDVLKLGHHGSRTSTSELFLRATTPELALISAGRDNSYGHPHKEVTDLLTRLGISSFSTQTEGTVILRAGAEEWNVVEK
jgi:competence protein ComEC